MRGGERAKSNVEPRVASFILAAFVPLRLEEMLLDGLFEARLVELRHGGVRVLLGQQWAEEDVVGHQLAQKNGPALARQPRRVLQAACHRLKPNVQPL
jgi:hypothetical protein